MCFVKWSLELIAFGWVAFCLQHFNLQFFISGLFVHPSFFLPPSITKKKGDIVPFECVLLPSSIDLSLAGTKRTCKRKGHKWTWEKILWWSSAMMSQLRTASLLRVSWRHSWFESRWSVMDKNRIKQNIQWFEDVLEPGHLKGRGLYLLFMNS